MSRRVWSFSFFPLVVLALFWVVVFSSAAAWAAPSTPAPRRLAPANPAALKRHVDYLALRHLYLPHYQSKNVRWGFLGRGRRVKAGLRRAEQRLVRLLQQLEDRGKVSAQQRRDLGSSLQKRLKDHYQRTRPRSLWERLPLTQGKRFPKAIPAKAGSRTWWRWLQRATHFTVTPYSKIALLVDGPQWRGANRKVIRSAKGHLHIASWGWHYDEQGKWYAQQLIAKKLGISPKNLTQKLKKQSLTQIRDERLAQSLARKEGIDLHQARKAIAALSEEQRRQAVDRLLEPITVRVLLGNLIQGVQMQLEQYSKNKKLGHQVLTDLRTAGIQVVLDNTLFEETSPLPRMEHAWAVVPHAKLTISQGVALTGGMNIGNHYLQKRGTKLDWHDAAVRVNGNLAGQLDREFLARWNRAVKATGQSHWAVKAATASGQDSMRYYSQPATADPRSGGNAMVVGTGVLGRQKKTTYSYRTALMMALAGTQEQFQMVTPYLTSPLLVKQLVRTAQRLKAAGKDPAKITVTVTGSTDTPLTGKFVTGHLVHLLQKSGITVRYWHPDPNTGSYTKDAIHHAKAWIADNKLAYIGSANGTVRSLVQDWEMGLLVDDPHFIGRLNREIFAKDRRYWKPPQRQTGMQRYAGHAVALLFGPILRLL